MLFRVVVPATVEPITLAQAKAHLRLSDDIGEFDSQILMWITAARQAIENDTSRLLAVQTIEVAFDDFPCYWRAALELPRGPYVSFGSMTYVDTDKAEQSLTDLVVDDFSDTPWVFPESGTTWPRTGCVVNGVRVTYVAGYTPETIPAALKQAMLLMVGHFDQNREAVIAGTTAYELPKAVDYLVFPYRLHLGV